MKVEDGADLPGIDDADRLGVARDPRVTGAEPRGHLDLGELGGGGGELGGERTATATTAASAADEPARGDGDVAAEGAGDTVVHRGLERGGEDREEGDHGDAHHERGGRSRCSAGMTPAVAA